MEDADLLGTPNFPAVGPLETEGSINKHKCPYDDCSESFTSTIALNEHMLSSHIMSPIIFGLEPRSQDTVTVQDFAGISSLDENPGNEMPGFIWHDLSCMSKFCVGLSPFETAADLISHYDSNHTFIPETLYLTGMDDNFGSSDTKANGD